MSQVAQQRAVGLVQGQAAARALHIVGLGHVQRDGAALVPGEDGWPVRQVGQQGVAGAVLRVGVVGCALQAQARQGVEQLALGCLDACPVLAQQGVGQRGQHVRLAAGQAQVVRAVGGQGEVAAAPVVAVRAQAVACRSGCRAALLP